MVLKKIVILVFVLIFAQLLYAQKELLTIKVTQFGKEVTPQNSIFELKPAEFKLEFTSENSNAFLVGTTFDEDLYRSAKGDADLEVAWFENTGMAEVDFNTEELILVSNDAPSYWYFENENDHRFDKNPTGNLKKLKAIRTTNHLYDLQNDKEINVSDFNKPLYLVFYTNEQSSQKTHKILKSIALHFNK